jgi:hypothetical protein
MSINRPLALSETEWIRLEESWAALFKPWNLVWHTDRILEETAGKVQGEIMRFERR